MEAVLSSMTDDTGVLDESLCGDGAVFKGIFVRYVVNTYRMCELIRSLSWKFM